MSSASTIISPHISVGTADLPWPVLGVQLHTSHLHHHSLDLIVSLSIGETFGEEALEALLGEDLTVQFGQGAVWKGFLDQLTLSQRGKIKVLEIKALSPTMFMESTPQLIAWSETSLSEITSALLKPYSGFFDGIQVSTKSQQVPWFVQTQESDYNALRRLLDLYGHSLWYDGQTLHCGQLTGNLAEPQVEFWAEEVEIGINLAPLNFRVYGYDYVTDDERSLSHETSYQGRNPLVRLAVKKSGKYPSQDVFLPYPVESDAFLKQAAKRIASKQAHESVVVRGKSHNPHLKIGSRVCLKVDDSSLVDASQVWVVMELNHVWGHEMGYQNGFVAIPIDHVYEPRSFSGRPLSSQASAIVVDAQDPKQLHRVKVSLIGDPNRAVSPWIRVLTPRTADGGMAFIPKPGERVSLSYDSFNGEHGAVVTGSYYFGEQKASIWSEDTVGFAAGKSWVKLTSDGAEISAEEVIIDGKESSQVHGGKVLVLSSKQKVDVKRK